MCIFSNKMWTMKLLLLLFFYFLLPPSESSEAISCPGTADNPNFATPEDALDYLRNDKSAIGIADSELVKVLLGCKGQFNFTLKQLNEFVEHRRNTFYKILSRKVPLCVLGSDNHTKLSRFKKIFEDLDKDDKELRLDKDKSKYYSLLKVWEPNPESWLESIEFRKIETADNTFGKHLHQWISLKLHFSMPGINGMIVQSIEGFLGIPFGQFSKDFDCINDLPLNITHFPDLNIIPCKYRPRTSLQHPQIFVVGGDEAVFAQTYTDLVFHFNWINSPCHDVAAFQFMIILGKTDPVTGIEVSHQSFLTPVYEVKQPSSYDGVPTHYYPDKRAEWTDKVICTKVTQLEPPPPKPPKPPIPLDPDDPDDLNPVPPIDEHTCLDLGTNCQTPGVNCDLGLLSPCYKSIIPISRTYDNCVTGHTQSRDGETCPPGPFHCTKFPKTTAEWDLKRKDNLVLLRQCGEHMPRQTRKDDKCKVMLNPEPANDWDHVKPNPELPIITTPAQIGRRRKRGVDDEDEVDDSDDSDVTSAKKTTATFQVRKMKKAALQLQYDDVDATEEPPITSNKSSTYEFEEVLNERQIFTREFQKLGIQHYKFTKRIHGLFMIVAFLVINPLSTYIARFFKETPAVSCCGIPRWMMAHIILSMISITIIWLGIVACLGTAAEGVVDCDKILTDGQLNSLCTDHQDTVVHMFLGTLTVAAFHLSAASAWCRPKESRGMYMTTHSLSGYFTFIGAAVSAIIVNKSVCMEIRFEAGILLIINIIFWSFESCLQLIQDKRLLKERHLFPMLEGLQVQESSPPCHAVKICIFFFAILAHFGGGALVVLSYIVMNNDDLYEERSANTSDGAKYRVSGFLFQNCELIDFMKIINITGKKT